MAGKRCAREGCRAWAMRGKESCRAHMAVAVAHPDQATDERAEAARAERAARVAEFKRRMASGKYRDLLERRVVEVMEEAGREGELIEEIGALRIVMKKLIAEDDDAERLSVSIPRVVNATVRALKAQHAISGKLAGDLTEALTRVLIEMGLGE